MGNDRSQIFEMGKLTLSYDGGKSILLCRETSSHKNLWVKKITDIASIENIIEDPEHFYVACERDDIKGYFLAIDKTTGATAWFIPGKAYFQIIFGGYLFLIFTDEERRFFMIKADTATGAKIWHHRVDGDLCEYSFRSDRILLTYESGKTESIVPATGTPTREHRGAG